MKKILSTIFAILLTTTVANANSIDKIISKSGIHKSAVAVSVRNVETGKVVYELNEKKPMTPASTLKAITYTAALNELGKDYNFKTALYKNTNNELILKLGADPYLTTGDLKSFLRTARSKNIYEPKAFKIDDSIIDNIEWGEGWQWDDELNPLMPKFSAYNLDGNMLTADVISTQLGAPAEIKLNVFYPITFMNLVTTGKPPVEIKIYRDPSIGANILTMEGVVKNTTTVEFPVNYPRRYFMIRLEEQIRNTKLGYYGSITRTKLPTKNVYLVDKVENPISEATIDVMQNSNNLVAESVFKIAGGHYAKTTGSAKNAIEMLQNYCNNIGVSTEDIKVVDGSGVSKNNLVTADFMTSFLSKQQLTPEIMAKAGEGTLKTRMLYFGDKLKAKTGTLSDVSAITGYLTTVSGKTYAFDIMINDPKSGDADKKMLEEYILRAIQTSY